MVKNAVCNGLGHPYTGIVTVILVLTLKSRAALRGIARMRGPLFDGTRLPRALGDSYDLFTPTFAGILTQSMFSQGGG